MSPSPSAPGSSQSAASLGYNLAALTLALALGGLALAYAIDGASSARRADLRAAGEVPLTRTIGGRDLRIPSSWFRYAEQQVEGFAKQVDLQLMLPLGEAGGLRPIEVTLLPPSRVLPSARLLDGVYLHRFGPDELSGPPGLVGKPLRGAEGFEGETVWYDALTLDPFVAKCSAPITPEASSRCVRTVHLRPGLAAVYAFDADVLANWKRFDVEMRERLEVIGVY